MIEVEFTPESCEDVARALKALKPSNLLKGELEPFAREVGMQAGKYAPPVAGSTYIRTGHLGRNWFTQVLDPLSVRVGNLAVYAGWVHGEEQAEWHGRHGWRRLFDTGRDMLSGFIHRIGRKIDLIWK